MLLCQAPAGSRTHCRWGLQHSNFAGCEARLDVLQRCCRVKSAGVNRADCMQREGNYPPPAGASTVLGLECCGTVLEARAAMPTRLSHHSLVCVGTASALKTTAVAGALHINLQPRARSGGRVSQVFILPTLCKVCKDRATKQPNAVCTRWS